jgi:hypothetical protein
MLRRQLDAGKLVVKALLRGFGHAATLSCDERLRQSSSSRHSAYEPVDMPIRLRHVRGSDSECLHRTAEAAILLPLVWQDKLPIFL